MSNEAKPEQERSSNRGAVERMIEFARTRSVKLPAGETVEALVREMRLDERSLRGGTDGVTLEE